MNCEYMEKVSYDIVFDLKNNPSEQLREINKLLIDMQGNTQSMANLMSQQLEMMRSPIDDMRDSWLNLSGYAGAYFAVLSENTAGIVSLIEIKKYMDELGVTTKIASTIQSGYNSVMAIGQNALNIYQARILTARAAISATTGATRALNIAIAASPYLIAAAAAAALAVGIYKIAASSNETDKAQKRLNDIMVEMNTQVAKETIALNDLFAPLNRAKEGSEEWQKAKDAILVKYGSYLEKIGVEIKDVDSARIAYSRLSQAILDTARARAMEKATSGAAETYAGTEGEALKNIREQLYSGIGEGAGKITARQAGKAWAQIRAAVRSGKDIPQEAREILEQTNTIYHDQFGTHTMSPIAEYIYRQVREVRQANDNYKKEIADAQAIFGGTGGVLPADAEAPIETQLTFTEDIVQLEDTIAGIRTRLERAKFEVKYTLKPTGEDADTPGASPIKDAMKSSLDKGGALDGFQIPMIDIEKPLSEMEKWNNALDAGREKNAATIESLGAMGGAMGALGNTVGGAAGLWLDWAGNCMQAIAQALPQLAALATANTATAATGAASSMAGIPFVGPVLAIAAVASVLGALANLPKFAAGGLAYGPTLGLFGEYAGAGNNPEVVAPLNKLRSLIQPAYGTGTGGTVEFKIAGRYLKGILNREGNLDNRS